MIDIISEMGIGDWGLGVGVFGGGAQAQPPTTPPPTPHHNVI